MTVATSIPLAAVGSEVVADFNDLHLGTLGAENQAADTGTGFSESFYQNETDAVIAITGDVVALSESNYVSGQGGVATSISHIPGAAARHAQFRPVNPLDGQVIWVSLLFSLEGDHAEAVLTFNGESDGMATLNDRFGIGMGSEQFPGAVAILDRIDADLDATRRSSGSNRQLSTRAVPTDGSGHLIIAKIENNAFWPDRVTLWVDPRFVQTEDSLGPYEVSYGQQDIVESLEIRSLGFEFVLADVPDVDTPGGIARIDNVRISDAANGLAVVASNAMPMDPDPLLTVVSTEIPFGLLPPASGAHIGEITIRNEGVAEPLVISSDTAVFGSRFLLLEPALPIEVAPSESAMFRVRFTPPPEGGSFSGSLTLQSNNAYGPTRLALFASMPPVGIDLLENGDFEHDGDELSGWAGEDNGTAGMVRVGPGILPMSEVGAEVALGGHLFQSIPLALADWYAEFFFRAPDAASQEFHVQVSSAVGGIDLRYQGTLGGKDHSWNALDEINFNDGWGPPLGLGSIIPGQVYYMRIVGHGWGSAAPTYDVMLSEPGSTRLTRTAIALSRFEGAVVGGPPRSIAFSADFGPFVYWGIDNVRVVNGVTTPLGAELELVSLTPHGDGTANIEWYAEVGESYAIEGADDLQVWTVVDSITADEALENYTGTVRFYRVRSMVGD